MFNLSQYFFQFYNQWLTNSDFKGCVTLIKLFPFNVRFLVENFINHSQTEYNKCTNSLGGFGLIAPVPDQAKTQPQSYNNPWGATKQKLFKDSYNNERNTPTLIFENSRGLNKSCQHHLNIFKSCINFQNQEGVARTLSLPRPFQF